MAWLLKLNDGTESVDFLGATYRLANGGLNIELPKPKEVWGGDSIYAHGSQLMMQTYDNAKAILTFSIHANTRDNLLASVTKINRIIEKAKLRSIQESGARVELQYAWEGASTVTYYEVISGSLRWADDIMSVEQVHQKDEKGNWVIWDFELELIIYPFAFPISPVNGSVSLVNIYNSVSPTPATTKLVGNRQETGTDNWIEVSGASIAGSHPAIANLSMLSESGLGEGTSKIYVGCHVGGSVRTMLDDFDCSFRIGSAISLDDTNSNKDKYSPLVFTSTTEVALAKWTLSAAEVQAMNGPFRFFGRTKDLSYWDTNANYAIAISYNGTRLYRTDWMSPIETTMTLLDFGTIFMPPWTGTITNATGLTVELLGFRKTAGSTTINLDYVFMMPQDGGYRVYEMRGTHMLEDELIVDDGWNRVVYHQTVAGNRTGLAFALMQPFSLRPAQNHRFYFLMEGSSRSSEISRSLTVSLGLVPSNLVMA